MLRLGCKYLHLVAALQLVAQRYELVVHLCTNAVASEEGVYLEREVEGCTPGRHCLDFTLGRKDEYFACEEVEFYCVKEVHGIGLRVVKDFLDGAEPVVQLAVVVDNLACFLVFPVCGEALFRHFVHAVAAYLHLNPLALLRHQRDM